MGGFVKLNRDLLVWSWANDIMTFGVYAKFLLLAAWKETEYCGVRLKRGEFLTNQSEIAQKTGLSRQQVRTVLDRLKATNKITIRREGKNSVITVVDYDCETDSNHIDNRVTTTCQPDSNQISINKKEDKEAEEPKNALTRGGGGFEANFNIFWVAYPNKGAEVGARKAWKELKPDNELLQKILSALEWQRESEQWTKEGGKYIPLGENYLKKRRWEDPPQTANNSASGQSNKPRLDKAKNPKSASSFDVDKVRAQVMANYRKDFKN